MGSNENGRCGLLLVVRRSAPVVSFAGCQYRFGVDLSSRVDANASRRLSGVQTGNVLAPAPTVTRVSAGRAHS